MTASLSNAVLASLTAQQIRQLPLSSLVPSPDNPRTSFDEVTLRELADSIRSLGIQVPLLVRSNGDEDTYEIIAGHRRFRAAAQVGLVDVPCIVRVLDDETTREIMVVENLQRDDLPPMEEAEAYAQLATILGSMQSVAARVGKPIAYVTRRLQLNSLGAWPQDALRARLITIDHALLLSKLGPAEQDSNLKWALDTNAGMKIGVDKVIADVTNRRDSDSHRYGYWQAQSALNLKNHIEQHTGRKLATAPWDLAATNLNPDGVACLGCPSNTDDNRALFSDMAIDEATCANGACFAIKQSTFVQIKMATVGEGALRLSWKLSEAAPRMDIADVKHVPGTAILAVTSKPNEKQVLREGQWIRAKAGSCANLRKGVTVDFQESRFMGRTGEGKPGDVLQVCITPKCKAHPKSYETREKRSNGGYDSVAEKKKREENAAAIAVENKIRMTLATEAIGRVDKLPAEALRALLLRQAQGCPKALIADLKGASLTGAAFAKAVAMLALQHSGLELQAWNQPKSERDEFLAMLKMLGVDGRSAWEPRATSKPKPTATPAKKKAVKKVAKKKAGAK